MDVRYGLTGKERKALVKAVEAITETPAKYLGMPSMAYQIGRYQIAKDGTLTVMMEGDGIIEDLKERGFIPEGAEEATEETAEETAEPAEESAEPLSGEVHGRWREVPADHVDSRADPYNTEPD